MWDDTTMIFCLSVLLSNTLSSSCWYACVLKEREYTDTHCSAITRDMEIAEVLNDFFATLPKLQKAKAGGTATIKNCSL